MWLWLLMPLAAAVPDGPLPRADEPLIERRFARVVGMGPAWGHLRRRSGPVRAWIFPDGVIEHAEIALGRHEQEVRRYDAAGHRLTTAHFLEGMPTEVVVHIPEEVRLKVDGWEAHTLPGATLRIPPASADHHITWQVVPGDGDPLSDDYRAGMLSECACLLESRATTWIDGRPGARYRVRLLDPDAPWTGEIWATRSAGSVLLLSALVPARADGAPAGGMAVLAVGGATAALARWEDEP
ncbi:MAG: hypothetical protein JRJ84_01390 [Deltaproteobacteria bacterium]|nr:hypothetical protein [Deltaproteobacteria bacterium]